MKKIFIIHGFRGGPDADWLPWFKSELKKEGFQAAALAMLAPDKPNKDEWVREITRAVGDPNEDIFLVGYSLGACTILHYLETLSEEESIGGAVLVSSPIHVLPKDKYRLIDDFVDKEFDFDHLKKVCGQFVVIHGENDEIVPPSHARELAQGLSCKVISVPNGGHFSSSEGWSKLPEVLTATLKMLK